LQGDGLGGLAISCVQDSCGRVVGEGDLPLAQVPGHVLGGGIVQDVDAAAYPDAHHRPLGPDGCGKVPDFVPYASASIEQLWKETEDKLHDALAATDDGTLLASAAHTATIKDAIALHYTRSIAARIVHFRTWELSLSQPQVSKHLRVLSEVGLVKCRAQGRHRLYSLEPARLRPLHEWLARYEQMWNERLDRMDDYPQELQRRESSSDI
jgi:DNA-binding transcriptional ArsR family regulator